MTVNRGSDILHLGATNTIMQRTRSTAMPSSAHNSNLIRCKVTTTLHEYFANKFSKDNFLADLEFMDKYLDILANSPPGKFYLKSMSWL